MLLAPPIPLPFMSAVKPHRPDCRGFTLLEMTLALLLSSFIISSVFMFVQVNLEAVEMMSESQQKHDQFHGFQRYLKGCLTSGKKPSELQLKGENSQIGTLPSDELTFQASGGNATFTQAEGGSYQLRLRLKDEAGDSVLGIERNEFTETGPGPETWVPLMSGVEGLDFQFFDASQSQWSDEWNNPNELPRLIRIQLWTGAGRTQTTLFLPPVETKW